MKKYFKFSMKVRLVTMSVLALLIFVTMPLFIRNGVKLYQVAVIALCWVPILATMLFTPIYYIKKENEVILRLLCFWKHYKLDDYQLESCELSSGNMVRLFASGGLFGFFGWFRHPDMGMFLMFCTGNGISFLKLTNKKSGKIVLIEE